GAANGAWARKDSRAAHAPRVPMPVRLGLSASRRNSLYRKSAIARTRSPTREARALPGQACAEFYKTTAAMELASNFSARYDFFLSSRAQARDLANMVWPARSFERP